MHSGLRRIRNAEVSSSNLLWGGGSRAIFTLPRNATTGSEPRKEVVERNELSRINLNITVDLKLNY